MSCDAMSRFIKWEKRKNFAQKLKFYIKDFFSKRDPVDLVMSIEEIRSGKFHFLCSKSPGGKPLLMKEKSQYNIASTIWSRRAHWWKSDFKLFIPIAMFSLLLEKIISYLSMKNVFIRVSLIFTATVQLQLKLPGIKFCAGSNPTYSVAWICAGENL